jgi:hypothetical protein
VQRIALQALAEREDEVAEAIDEPFGQLLKAWL